MAFKRRLLSKGMEDFDNGIVEEINATELEAANEETKEVMEDVALDIAAVENLSEAESALEAEVQQAEVNVAAMDGAERPEVSTVEVVNPEGQVVEEEATVIPADVQPTLNQDSTDMEVAEAVKEQVQSMENIAGGMDFGRLANLYKDFGVRTGHIPSFESMVKNPRAEYKASLEGMKETLVKIKDAIVAFIKGIWAKLKGAWNAVVKGVKALKNKAFGLKQRAKDVSKETIEASATATKPSTESYGMESSEESINDDAVAGCLYVLTPGYVLLEEMGKLGGSIPGYQEMIDKLTKAKSIDEIKSMFKSAWSSIMARMSDAKETWTITEGAEDMKNPVLFIMTSPKNGYAVDMDEEDPTNLRFAKVSYTISDKLKSEVASSDNIRKSEEIYSMLVKTLDASVSAINKFENSSRKFVSDNGEKLIKLAEETSKRTDIDNELASYMSKVLRTSAAFDAQSYNYFIYGLKNQVRMQSSCLFAIEQQGGLAKVFETVARS